MTDVDELIALFHSMDDEGQEYLLETAKRQAKRRPRQRPALRLVSGKIVTATLGSQLGGIEDVGLPGLG
jgi:hypothetical protein